MPRAGPSHASGDDPADAFFTFERGGFKPVAAVVIHLVEIAAAESGKRTRIALLGLRHKLGVAAVRIDGRRRDGWGCVPESTHPRSSLVPP